MEVIGTTNETGTTVTFKPDDEIFTETQVYDYEILKTRLKELAFLNKGLKLVLSDERIEGEPRKHEFCYEGGLNSFVEYLNESKEKTGCSADRARLC